MNALIVLSEDEQLDVLKSLDFRCITYNKSVILTRKFVASQFAHTSFLGAVTYLSGNEYVIICYDVDDTMPTGAIETDNIYHIEGLQKSITRANELSGGTTYIFNHQSIYSRVMNFTDEIWSRNLEFDIKGYYAEEAGKVSLLKSLGLMRYHIFRHGLRRELLARQDEKFRLMLNDEYDDEEIEAKQDNDDNAKLFALLEDEKFFATVDNEEDISESEMRQLPQEQRREAQRRQSRAAAYTGMTIAGVTGIQGVTGAQRDTDIQGDTLNQVMGIQGVTGVVSQGGWTGTSSSNEGQPGAESTVPPDVIAMHGEQGIGIGDTTPNTRLFVHNDEDAQLVLSDAPADGAILNIQYDDNNVLRVTDSEGNETDINGNDTTETGRQISVNLNDSSVNIHRGTIAKLYKELWKRRIFNFYRKCKNVFKLLFFD